MNPSDIPNSAPRWLFVATAKALQGYVFRSNALKEMVGASELIEQLPKNLFRTAVAHLAVEREELTSAAGGIRAVFASEQAARQLIRVWPVLVAKYAPGLETAVTLLKIDAGLKHAIEEAERHIAVNRQQPAPAVPPAPPLAARNRRTGLPAVKLAEALSPEERRPEPVDAEAARKRVPAKGFRYFDTTAASAVRDKVTPEGPEFAMFRGQSAAAIQRWPRDLNQFADVRNQLAVLHADANGLGNAIRLVLKKLPSDSERAEQLYTEFSDALTRATERAAQAAVAPLLRLTLNSEWPEIPFRPLVCAGEDFTAVIDPRFAVPLTAAYLRALERTSEIEFDRLRKHAEFAGKDLPAKLTAAAGLVFCKRNYPFSAAYELAEKLCAQAKKATSRQASALSFHRIKSSLLPEGDADAVLRAAFHTGDAWLTMNPYLVGADKVSGLATLDALLALTRRLSDRRFPRGPLRELVSRAYEGRAAADEVFARLKLVRQEADEGAPEEDRIWPGFADALKLLTCGESLWSADAGLGVRTPVYDALELRDWLQDEDWLEPDWQVIEGTHPESPRLP